MPSDCFFSLNLPRAPWLDAAAVTEAFHAFAAANHPDVSGGSESAFAELNAAWQTLRDPVSCLRHFLELEHPTTLASAERVPLELGDLFMEIATLRQSLDQLSAREAAATSPIARAVLASGRAALDGKRTALYEQLDAMRNEIIAELRAGARESSRLAELHTRLVFLAKWAAQLRAG